MLFNGYVSGRQDDIKPELLHIEKSTGEKMLARIFSLLFFVIN